MFLELNGNGNWKIILGFGFSVGQVVLDSGKRSESAKMTRESSADRCSLTSGAGPSMVPIDIGGRATGTVFVVMAWSLTSETNWDAGAGKTKDF